ncbi:hypothetical protein PVAP13_9NG175938 [Panicum virgatum]|uniref:Uncharacterized protein n=1 Tax=Panicum virgatum TaxID=38727 RepID=A0A8T0MGJ8_PANVG|nr:hypothetical protein PVAP13_9NG175938 [Panicum virgatum]
MICRYWWSQQEENRIHWLSLDFLCSGKEKGGLGYRDLHLFNLAMLARQGRRLLIVLDSLCTKVLRAKYFPGGDPLVAKDLFQKNLWPRKNMECRIHGGRGFMALKEGLIWRVGDGTRINIWSDPWIPNGVSRKSCNPRGRLILNKVADLIDPATGQWDQELIQDAF